MKCNRCDSEIDDGADESCWFCLAPLCFECWDSVGHCGHTRADTMNNATREFNRVWNETHDKNAANAAYRAVMNEDQ